MTEELVTIEINDQPYQVRKGAMLIEVADNNGITIPRFCYHKKLSIAANCRMCLVEMEKSPKLGTCLCHASQWRHEVLDPF